MTRFLRRVGRWLGLIPAYKPNLRYVPVPGHPNFVEVWVSLEDGGERMSCRIRGIPTPDAGADAAEVGS